MVHRRTVILIPLEDSVNHSIKLVLHTDGSNVLFKIFCAASHILAAKLHEKSKTLLTVIQLETGAITLKMSVTGPFTLISAQSSNPFLDYKQFLFSSLDTHTHAHMHVLGMFH